MRTVIYIRGSAGFGFTYWFVDVAALFTVGCGNRAGYDSRFWWVIKGPAGFGE
jgi:hypothetical protein